MEFHWAFETSSNTKFEKSMKLRYLRSCGYRPGVKIRKIGFSISKLKQLLESLEFDPFFKYKDKHFLLRQARLFR